MKPYLKKNFGLLYYRLSISDKSWLVWYYGDSSSELASKLISPSSTNQFPIFTRIRSVELDEINTETVLQCSCLYPKRYRRPCHHMLCVLGVDHPSLHSPRWYKHYSYYGESDYLEFAQISNCVYPTMLIIMTASKDGFQSNMWLVIWKRKIILTW